MSSKYWIKLYHEILDDPKMGLLPDDVWRVAIELMLLAGELDDGGNIPDLIGIAWRLRKTCNETLQKQLQALQSCNILLQNDDKTFLVVNFAERQKAASGAERVRQYRKRAKNKGVTKRYPDIDIDIDKESLRALTSNYEDTISVSISPNLSDEFKAYAAKVKPEWVFNAFKAAEDNQVLKWSYVRAILDECIKAGRWSEKPKQQSTKQQRNNNGHSKQLKQSDVEEKRIHAENVKRVLAKRKQAARL